MTNTALTQAELATVKNLQNQSPVVRFLRSKTEMNFQVGDYLIKMNKGSGDKWKPETISHVSEIPKRFICVYEDEYGIKYIKQLTSMGDELPLLIQLTDVNEWTRYVVDPEYAEHIILSADGEKFTFADKRKEEKARRELITRKNKKISEKTTDDPERVDQIFQTMKPGDKFWFSYNIPEAATSGYYIFHGMKKAKKMWSPHKNQRDETYVISYEGPFGGPHNWGPNKRDHESEEFLNTVIFTREPHPYETI